MEFKGTEHSIRVNPSPVRSVSPGAQTGKIPWEMGSPGDIYNFKEAASAASRSQTGSRIVDSDVWWERWQKSIRLLGMAARAAWRDRF